MSEDQAPKVTSNKTFVRGSFLYSHDGFDYEQKRRQIQLGERIIEDKMSMGGQFKKDQNPDRKKQIRKKMQSKNEKTVLIPIRDTPVEPVPEPLNQNQKCERATQEQFQYFQTYISQKEKERKFEEEQSRKITEFVLMQSQLKRKEEQANLNISTPVRNGISLVMEKQQTSSYGQNNNKKRLVKIKIKKKEEIKVLSIESNEKRGEQKQVGDQELELDILSKVRVVEE